MNTEKFSDGTRTDRRQVAVQLADGHLTIAQSIRRSSNPHHAAITSFTRREAPNHGQRIYYFEDGSFLTFEVSYMAVEDGGR